MVNEHGAAVQQWRDLKFGLFVHWGIYSLLARGEWVMYGEKIPVREYEKLAAQFNPVKFDAREWVKTVKRAGMRYIVITAKHHDGFSMFKTSVSPFNIVDATPFGRDPMAELAEACRQEGIKLGFYYSHVREWRHPMAQSFESQDRDNLVGNYGNYWDYPDENKKNLQVYIDEFDIPQVRELLTQYGDILTIWFDTPSMIRPDQAEVFSEMIHKLQPSCLINSRLCNNIETDYRSSGDNEIPQAPCNEPWETCMTMGRGWGYIKDEYFGEAETMIRSLISIAGKGGNFLLNVGPSPLGEIPLGAQKELAKVGDWMAQYGDAIYGSSASPFKQQPSWGMVTQKGSTLYLFVTDLACESIVLTGLYNKVTDCRLLPDKTGLAFSQTPGKRIEISLPAGRTGIVVAALSCEGEIKTEDLLIPGDTGSICLPAALAQLHKNAAQSRLSVNFGGVTTGWLHPEDFLSWEFGIGPDRDSGRFSVDVKISSSFWGVLDWGHELDILIDDQTLTITLEDDGGKSGYQERGFSVGSLELKGGGIHHCSLHPRKIETKEFHGLSLLNITLTPLE